MPSREIITLQIGNYSNFLGTHWWNSQESSFCYDSTVNSDLSEINHDVLYREGENPRGEITYTPRLILIDLKENFKTLNKDGVLYNMPIASSTTSLWHGKWSTFKSDSLSKNEFLQDLDKEEESVYPDLSLKMTAIDEDRDICQAESSSYTKTTEKSKESEKKFYNLDDSITTWSDFLRIHYHPKSICFIEDFNYENEFDGYGCGLEAFNQENMHDLIEETLRYFAEECDHLQGFQILMDGYNGFSAVANGILEHMEDNYLNKARLCFPLYSPSFTLWKKKRAPYNDISQYCSSIMGYNSLATYSHLFSPLDTNSYMNSGNPNFPHLNYKTEMAYHTSAILSIALDTVTLPMRLKTNAIHPQEMINSLAILGQKLIPLTLCTPIPIGEYSYLNDVLNSSDNVNFVPLTPCCDIEEFDIVSQFITIRGLPESKIFNNNSDKGPKMTTEKVLRSFLQYNYSSSMNFWKLLKEPFKTTTPFPHIFSSKINVHGFIGSSQRPSGKGVESVSAISGFHNTKNASNSINVLLQMMEKSKLKTYLSSKETGIEYDDFLDALENLKVLAECYDSS